MGWYFYSFITCFFTSRMLQKALCRKGSLKTGRLRKNGWFGLYFLSPLLNDAFSPQSKPIKTGKHVHLRGSLWLPIFCKLLNQRIPGCFSRKIFSSLSTLEWVTDALLQVLLRLQKLGQNLECKQAMSAHECERSKMSCKKMGGRKEKPLCSA